MGLWIDAVRDALRGYEYDSLFWRAPEGSLEVAYLRGAGFAQIPQGSAFGASTWAMAGMPMVMTKMTATAHGGGYVYAPVWAHPLLPGSEQLLRGGGAVGLKGRLAALLARLTVDDVPQAAALAALGGMDAVLSWGVAGLAP